jgi:hypothetical protein
MLAKAGNTVRSMRIFIGGQNNIYSFRWRGIDPVNDQFPLPRAYNMGLNIRF